MGNFNYEATKKPEFFQENRLPHHSDHVPVGPGGESLRLSLTGTWRFCYAESVAEAPAEFYRPDFDVSGWDTIPVPAHIQLHGYGTPQYVNIEYPWDGTEQLIPGQVPSRRNPTASYVRFFTLPEDWIGRPVRISFQGVESGLAVWLNGHYVGYGEDGFTPSEYDLTPYLVPGENRLAVRVFQWTVASWVEDQDFFRFSGIFRDVFLYSVPRAHVEDLRIGQTLAEDFSRATLTVSSKTVGSGRCSYHLTRGGLALEAEGKLGDEVRFTVQAPALWSAEYPNLYTLEITVFDENGDKTETITQNVGFRRFEIRDGIMRLNGERILLHGVNRHEFSSTAGRCVTREETEKDIVTMKRHNINAIRTSHYPNQSFFYELCDRYGMYVVDEMNLESHGAWNMMDAGLITLEQHVPGDNPAWLPMVLDRAEAMLRRDRNHPCVLIWSCGNESFGGKNLLEVSRYFHRMDDRPVHYEGVASDTRYPETTDIFSTMYWPAEQLRDYLAEHREKPAFSCEFGHAMGNSFGNQKRYADLARELDTYQGGFIWDYIDQALVLQDRYGKPYQGFGGDFDDRPSDYEFCGDGLVFSGDRSPSPKMQEVKRIYQDLESTIAEGKITVTNYNLFTPSSDYACLVSLHRQGIRLAEATMETAVLPGESKTYDLPLWPEKMDDEYTVSVSFRLRSDTAWAPAGHEVAFHQAVLGKIPAGTHPARAPEVIDGCWNVGVRGEGFCVLFSKIQCGLVSYRYHGRELLKSIPRANFWRAPTDNDRGSNAPARYAQWKIASLYQTVKKLPDPSPDWDPNTATQVHMGENYVCVRFISQLPTQPRTLCTISYRVYADGTVEAALSSDAPKLLGPAPEFGMLMKLSADLGNLRFYGCGPAETYCDRATGGRIGIFDARVADSVTPYLRTQECGNHVGVRWAEVTDDSGFGLRFAADSMEFSALPYTPEELESANHSFELPQVHYTVIRAAVKQMGLAGDDSWGAVPAQKDLLPADSMNFQFSFRGIDRQEDIAV